MDHSLPFSRTARPRAAIAIRKLAVGVLLAFGLAACGGGNPNLAETSEPLAERQDVASLVRIADHLRERGELTTSIALYQRAATSSDDARELVLLGRALAEAGATERAAGAYRQALSRDPEDPDAMLGLGKAYLSLGEIDKSIQYLQQLVNDDDGTDTVRYAALGAALDIAGRHEQAVATYTAGLQVFPNDLTLKSNLALSYAVYDRHAEAIDLMVQVTDALDARRSHHRNLVLVLALAGQDRDAVATGLRLLGEKETQDVMALASTARRLPAGADRARAVGLS